jgi:hypothetical protein
MRHAGHLVNVRQKLFKLLYKNCQYCAFDGFFNPLNAELNPICHLLTLLGAHHILHISRIRVKQSQSYTSNFPICLMTWTQITVPVYLEGPVAGFLNTLHNQQNVPLLENTARNHPHFSRHYYNKCFTNYQPCSWNATTVERFVLEADKLNIMYSY